MRIDPNGKVGIGADSRILKHRHNKRKYKWTWCFSIRKNFNIDGTFRSFVSFERNGTSIGTILCNSNGTQYNASSDHRLKENVVTMSNAEWLKQLQQKI